ncbi:MAG TPA: STAS domain-containing protein [Actinomycetota bacterium]|nr:STAS domain-containing protein [Actinomycetota bacterium]
MQIDRTMRDGSVIVALTGPINLFTAPQVQRALLKDLADRPHGIVCDLTGVESIDPVCATVFSTVANHPSSDWPATAFLLFGAPPAVAEVLERLASPHSLPIYDTLEDALDRVADRPPYLRDELRLAATATAPAAARRYVRDVLEYWRLALPDDGVIDRVELLADELVTNAVLHARTSLRLRLELRGDILHIGVHDDSPRLLRLVASDPDGETGRGLRLVEQLATAWGVSRRSDGGKVVWCTLRLWPRPGPAAESGA